MQEKTPRRSGCITCGADDHEARACPHYTDEDRQMMIGAQLFVNEFTELGEYGQNCLNEGPTRCNQMSLARSWCVPIARSR